VAGARSQCGSAAVPNGTPVENPPPRVHEDFHHEKDPQLHRVTVDMLGRPELAKVGLSYDQQSAIRSCGPWFTASRGTRA
jgi:hypothetical protein